MAKHLRDEPQGVERDEADRHAKKLKSKEKGKTSEAPGTHEASVQLDKKPSNGGKTSDGVKGVKADLSKEERRALKRARKEAEKAADATVAAESVADATGDAEAAAKAERKAARRAEKAAKKVKQEADGESNGRHELETRHPPAATGLDAASTTDYLPHPELSAAPQSDIDTFLNDNHISVQDGDTVLRPITHFKYLPITDEAQRAPFKGFTAPTPIQAAAWPYLFSGKDVIGVAETGSGKTLAFGVPCIRRLGALGKKDRRHIGACVVSPTRELALQIHEQLSTLAETSGLKATCVYGGVSKDVQRETLKGTNIVVATPGRLNDFIQEGSIDLSKVGYLVLDEADRMLDKGFEEEIRKIISTTPSQGRQTLMFTATWPPSVRDLAGTYMHKPVRVNIGDNPTGELRANARIVQEVEVMEQSDKQNRLVQLIKQYQSGKNRNDRILIFCLYKKEATRIEEFIRRRGFNVAGIHGDLSQQKRTESLEAFKQGTVPLLVATDVAARGLDIPAVKVVINVTFPLTAEDYVHRIGR